MIWQTLNNKKEKQIITEISTEILDKEAKPIGEKRFFNIPNEKFLNEWITKPKTNDEIALPLSNAFKISSNPRIKTSCDNMIGFLYASNNDLQHAGQETLISSSIFTGGNGGGLYIIKENLEKAAIVFAVRLLPKHTWVNHNDQFLQPEKDLSEEFKNDCLMHMLFNGKNLTASADGLDWNDKKWSIVNHFIPFTEEEVGATGRFESDFMVKYFEERGLPEKFSPEARAVLEEGKKLWQAYFSQTDEYRVRDELKLNRADVGWYQVRNALKKRNQSGDFAHVDFSNFEKAYKNLSEKLLPQVYELGFLKN